MTRQEAAQLARAAKAAKAPSLENRFWSKVVRRSDDDCWLWIAAPRRKDEGYGAFWLNGRHQPASKVAWILTHGDIDPGLVVCHTCDNPPCCNPSHLFIGMPIENDRDRIAKGRQCRGSKQKYAVLTEQTVAELRVLVQRIGLKQAANQMGINYFTAWDACNRRWRHVNVND